MAVVVVVVVVVVMVLIEVQNRRQSPSINSWICVEVVWETSSTSSIVLDLHCLLGKLMTRYTRVRTACAPTITTTTTTADKEPTWGLMFLRIVVFVVVAVIVDASSKAICVEMLD